MPTERELQEWFRKAKASRKRSKRGNSVQNGLIVVIALLLALVALKSSYKSDGLTSFPELSKLLPTSPFKNISSPYSRKPISIRVGNAENLQQYDYSSIDNFGASTRYNGTSIKELARILSSNAKTDLAKARMIYAWIAHHIAYDVSGYLSGNYGDVSPEGVLRSRKAVCSGYANLYKALAQKMGLESFVIEGYAKGAGYALGDETQINHAWNAVKIDGAWYLLDSTWGAGHLDNKQFVWDFNPFYFASSPSQFVYNHLPTDDSWQLLSQPYSKQQFDQLPEISPAFFEYGLSLASHQSHTIRAEKETEILLNVPENVTLISELSSQNSPLGDDYTLIQKRNNQTGIYVTLPSAGTYQLNIYANPKGKKGTFDHVISYRIIANY